MKPETKFRMRVQAYLKKMKPPVFSESIQQKTICGTPDILCCMNGHFVAIEIKSKGGKLSSLQRYKLQQIIDSGGMGIEINPDNWEEAKYVLEHINQGKEDA